MESVERNMVCKNLKQLTQISVGGTLSRLDIVRAACHSCVKLDVCPAISIDEFEFMELQSANSKLDSETGISKA